jgi:asparagine synthetase B (glutamine-hydrolysing)
MNEAEANLRDVLLFATEKMLRTDEVGLLLSGGTDSMTVLWCLQFFGVRVQAYTFYLEGRVSKDVMAARLASETYGVPLTEIEIPYQSTGALAFDVAQLVHDMGSARKTAVECTWPFMHVTPFVVEEQMFTGMSADDLYGSAAHMQINYGKNPSAFRAKRAEQMADERTGGWCYVRDLFNRDAIELCAPYRDEVVIDWFLQRSFAELHTPKQKGVALRAFEKEYAKTKMYRRQSNLQVGSGIREYMARMLDDPEVNPKGRKWLRGDQGGLYGDWL